MRIELHLSQREVEAVLRAHLSNGHGVVRSQALRSAEFKIREALVATQSDEVAVAEGFMRPPRKGDAQGTS